MADLEQRVAVLEREMTILKASVAGHDEELKSIPDLIKLEFRLANSQFSRLNRDVFELKDKLNGLEVKFNGLESKFEALPRAVAELVVELIGDRGKRGS